MQNPESGHLNNKSTLETILMPLSRWDLIAKPFVICTTRNWFWLSGTIRARVRAIVPWPGLVKD